MPKVLPLNRTTRRRLKKLLHDQLDDLLTAPSREEPFGPPVPTNLDQLLEAVTRGQRLTVSVHVLDPEAPRG